MTSAIRLRDSFSVWVVRQILGEVQKFKKKNLKNDCIDQFLYHFLIFILTGKNDKCNNLAPVFTIFDFKIKDLRVSLKIQMVYFIGV